MFNTLAGWRDIQRAPLRVPTAAAQAPAPHRKGEVLQGEPAQPADLE